MQLSGVIRHNTYQQNPCRAELQSPKSGGEYPLPPILVCKSSERHCQQDPRNRIEGILPPKNHSHSLLNDIFLTQLFRHGAVWSNLAGIDFLVMAETYGRFVDTGLGRFGKESSHVDNGEEEENEDAEKNPWLIFLWYKYLRDRRRGFGFDGIYERRCLLG